MARRVISFILSMYIMLMNFFGIKTKMRGTADAILMSMTLEEKICQMIMPAFTSWNGSEMTELKSDLGDIIKKYDFGGVILFAANTKGTEQTARLTYNLQSAARQSRHGIPLLISTDQEGGHVTRLQTGTGTTGNMGLGALNDPAETTASAGRIGEELSSLGINTDFAPVLDVNCNPSNPVIGLRSFSSDPYIAAAMGSAFIEGLHSHNVATALKHFPGHGDTATDSHTGLPLIDRSYDELKARELIPFKAGIDAGTDLIMTAHIVYPQIETDTYTSVTTGEKINLPATLSKKIITGILRNDLGFDGVVTTDAMSMAAISKNFTQKDAAIFAINAGVDMLLMPVTVSKASDCAKFDNYIKMIASAVNSGKISEKRINESAGRILALKERRGILEDETITPDERVALAKQFTGSYSHFEAELKTAAKAVTVLKNDGVLPLVLENGKKPVFFYPYADENNSVLYAYGILKKSGKVASTGNPPCYIYPGKSVDEFTSAISLASSVVVFSESKNANYFNPKSSSGQQAVFINALINKAHSLGKKVTVVSLQLPYDAAAYTKADAIVLAYGSKTMPTVPTEFNGETASFGINIPASVIALFGGENPMGRCPVDIPVLSSDHKYTDKILYPVGSGLSY